MAITIIIGVNGFVPKQIRSNQSEKSPVGQYIIGERPQNRFSLYQSCPRAGLTVSSAGLIAAGNAGFRGREGANSPLNSTG
jgi:hypothetical protein